MKNLGCRAGIRCLGLMMLMVCFVVPIREMAAGWYDGITSPVKDSVLGSPSDGVIGEIFVGEGDQVRSGEDVLALRSDSENVEVRRRQVTRDLAEKDLNRLKEVAEKTRAVSAGALETAEAKYKIAEAELELAKARVRDRRVIAPFDGVIADLLEHEVGEGTRIGEPLVRLVNTDKMILDCSLPSFLGGHLKLGDKVKTRVAGYSGWVALEGKIIFISPVVHAASGLLPVKVEISNREQLIRPGVMGSILIEP